MKRGSFAHLPHIRIILNVSLYSIDIRSDGCAVFLDRSKVEHRVLHFFSQKPVAILVLFPNCVLA